MKRINLTNLLLVIAIALALMFIYVTYGTYKKFSYEQKRMQAFYITNAGINQAIWYLSTPPEMGGFGPAWRVNDMRKYFSVGSYVISVSDGVVPEEIVIASVGEAEGVKLMLKATVIYGQSLPEVFNYALYSGGELRISGRSVLTGNIYVNDNVELGGQTIAQGGLVITTPGYNIESEPGAVFRNGKASRPYPLFPVLDTTYFYNKISLARSRDKGVLQGNVAYKDIELSGRTILVNGNVTVTGSIRGHGAIVASRNMTISGNGGIDNGVMLICDGKLSVSGKHTVRGNAYLYSKQKLSLENNTSINGRAVILSPTVVEIGSGCDVSGLIYAPSVAIGEASRVEGSLAAENFSSALPKGYTAPSESGGLLKNVTLTHNASILPLSVTGFNIGSKVIMRKPGDLKEVR